MTDDQVSDYLVTFSQNTYKLVVKTVKELKKDTQ